MVQGVVSSSKHRTAGAAWLVRAGGRRKGPEGMSNLAEIPSQGERSRPLPPRVWGPKGLGEGGGEGSTGPFGVSSSSRTTCGCWQRPVGGRGEGLAGSRDAGM